MFVRLHVCLLVYVCDVFLCVCLYYSTNPSYYSIVNIHVHPGYPPIQAGQMIIPSHPFHIPPKFQPKPTLPATLASLKPAPIATQPSHTLPYSHPASQHPAPSRPVPLRPLVSFPSSRPLTLPGTHTHTAAWPQLAHDRFGLRTGHRSPPPRPGPTDGTLKHPSVSI